MQSPPDIDTRIGIFLSDLEKLSDSVMVRKYVTFGSSYLLDDELYFELKSEVSHQFDVHPSEVIMVGSGKLGFSIAPTKRFQHFNDESDLDVAIISAELFDSVWKDVFDLMAGGEFLWHRAREFKDYLFRGWIRPDKLPPANIFRFRQEWWNFFQRLENQGVYGNYKLRAGIYKSWNHLESYQVESIRKCRDNLL